MAIQARDIKIYLTGLSVDGANYDGSVAQTNPNISFGGFRSSTEVNGSSQLSATINSTATSIQVDQVENLPGASVLNPAYAVIEDEMISYTARSTSSGSGYLIGVTRGVNGRVPASHGSGVAITGVTSQNLFDHVRASENASGDIEYRCFAVLNTNTADTAFNVKVYLSPVAHSGSASSAVSAVNATLTDNTLIGNYLDDFFNGGTLRITGGTGYGPSSSDNLYDILYYNDTTGTFTLSGNWKLAVPDNTTTFIATSTKASPNPYDTVSFAIERHWYSRLDGSGIATGGSQTYLIDSSLPGAGWTSSLHFVGAYILLLTGDGVDGIPKRITAYDTSTGRIDISGSFVNTGVSAGDLYTIVRGPTRVMISGEGVEPPVGTGNISSWSTATSIETAQSINVNSVGEDLIHDELFFVWMKRSIAPNSISYTNDNVIPNIYFEA